MFDPQTNALRISTQPAAAAHSGTPLYVFSLILTLTLFMVHLLRQYHVALIKYPAVNNSEKLEHHASSR